MTPLQKELCFGPFELRPGQRQLLENGQVVRIGNRALDILLALVGRAGAIATKEELIAAAWPDTIVEEINLRVHIAALRRALGEHQFIINVAGRGYSFVGELREVDAAIREPAAAPATAVRDNLPANLTRLIGRDSALAALAQLIPERRLLTIVGTGGIGKSTLALAVAAQLREHYPHGTYFIDLAAVGDSAAVPASVATALGLTIPTSNPLPNLLAFMQQKRMLLVMDNCEHLIYAVADLCEHLLKHSADIHILATSREPLGVEGEWLHRLPPLEVPHLSAHVDSGNATRFSAVQLFLERARAQAQGFRLADANAAKVGDICRRLDGIPLAIELAASRLGMFGVEELANRLDDHFLLIAQGRRTAAPRHQTLRATLHWSYQLLSADEQRVLRRLAIFSGSFAVESALAVAGGDAGDGEQQLFDNVLNLSDKSLLALESNADIVRHRLLHMTRAFALEKLVESGERPQVLRWHAEHHRELLRKAELDWDAMNKPSWAANYAHAIDDIRAALDWAFSAAGDVLLGAELTVAAMPFGFQLGLLDEFRDRVEHALQRLAALSTPQPALVSQLNSMMYVLAWNTEGELSRRGASAAAASTELSERVEIVRLRIEPQIVAVIDRMEIGRYAEAVECAGQLQATAAGTGDGMAVLIADRTMAQAQHFAGAHARAREYAQRVLRHPARSIPLGYQRLTVDRRVSMRIVLARILWLEGGFEQAAQMCDEGMDYALRDTPFAICQTLALAACPIALWNGDHERARGYIEQLHDVTTRFRMAHWHDHGKCFAAALQARLQPAAAPVASAYPHGLKRDTLLTIEPALVADVALDTTAPHGWCAPEVLRVRADLLAMHDPDAARHQLQQALELARAQHALAWQLRIATSLGQLAASAHTAAHERDAALELLATLHRRHAEGPVTRDLQRAEAQLAALGDVATTS